MDKRQSPPASDARAPRLAGAVFLLLLGSLPFGAPVHAEDQVPGTPAEKRTFVAKCLADLRSPAFEVREAARQGLEEHGAAARDLLEAARDDPDPEVRRAVGTLLARLGGEEAVVALPFDDLSGMGRVTLEASGSVRSLLDDLGALCGASFAWPEGHPEADAAESVVDAPFFVALERLLGAADLTATQGFDGTGRMELTPAGTTPSLPWAASGPMRVRVVEVTSVRTLREPGSRRWVLVLDVDWMPGVQLHQYKNPAVVEATDAGGRAYRAGAGMRASTTYGLGSTSRSARVQLHLQPEEAADGAGPSPAELKRLVFTLPVTLRHDRRSLRFEDPLALDLPATLRHGDSEHVTLTAIGRPEAERGFWAFDLSTRLFTDDARLSVLVLVEGPDGRIGHASAGSRFPSADGSVALSARTYGRADEAPRGLEVVWYGRQESGELRFTLTDVPLR